MPMVPAINVKKTDSKIICFLIWLGLAPIARLIPISFVLSYTDINKIFPIPITPANIVAIPIIIEIKDIPFAKFLARVKKEPKLNDPIALLSSGCTLCISFNWIFTLFSTSTISISS